MIRPLGKTKEELYNGCILVTVAAAVTRPRFMILSYELDWEDRCYLINDSCGCRGVICFHDDSVVGALQSIKSSRFKWREGEAYFKKAPKGILEIARRDVLPYLLTESGPTVTTAFWSKGNSLVSSDKWKDFIRHGGYALQYELEASATDQLQGLRDNYDMTEEEYELMCLIHEAVRMCDSKPLRLNKEWLERVIKIDDEGKQSSMELFRGIGIQWR